MGIFIAFIVLALAANWDNFLTFALLTPLHLDADELGKTPQEDTGDPISESWLFDWVMSGQMGITGWKQVRMSRNGDSIHLDRLTFEGLSEISETSSHFEVVDEWQGEGRNGVLLLQERKAEDGGA